MLVERGADRDYVKVVDFGIAKIPVPGQALTALGSVFGTPDYMAPEQARGGTVDARTDLYTLGIVLYEMLAGDTPFSSENLSEIILAQITQPPPPLPTTVDPELAALVLQLLEKDPAKRVQTAAELAERLRAILMRLTSPQPAPAAPRTVPLQAVPGPAPLQAPHAYAPPQAPQGYGAPPSQGYGAQAPPVYAAHAPPPAAGFAPPPSAPLYATQPAAAAPLAAPAAYPAAAPGVPLEAVPAARTGSKSAIGCVVAVVVLGLLVLLAWVIAQVLLGVWTLDLDGL
jgi:serine/threonine-protein kinase